MPKKRCYGAEAVLQDLAAGDDPLSFPQATRHPLLPGHVSGVHRLATTGKTRPGQPAVILESAETSGRKVTTRAAIERFIRRVNNVPDTPIPQSDGQSSAHQRAVARLAAVGI